MRLVDLHVPTSRQSLELNPDLRSLAATHAKRTAASDLRHCATGKGIFNDLQCSKMVEDITITMAGHQEGLRLIRVSQSTGITDLFVTRTVLAATFRAVIICSCRKS